MVALDQKNKVLLNLISHPPDTDKIYLYANDPYETKYPYLNKTCETIGSEYCNKPKAITEYSNDMKNICKNTEEHNPNKKNAKY